MKTTKKIAKKVLIAHIYLAVVVLTGQVFAQTGAWTPTGSMSGARHDHTATLLTDGKVLINRGTGGAAELYDPVTGAFSPTGPSLGGGFAQGSTATRLQDGRVLIVGGSTVEIYNPPTGTFTPAGNLNIARFAHTATLLSNGKVLIVGGLDLGIQQHIATSELYDPATNSFTLAGILNVGRFSHSATLLQDGRVLIAAGEEITSPGFSNSLSSAELYDPATGAFSPTGNLNQPRCCLYFTQAPLLNNGKVLIVGGFPTQAAEIFDPATGTFSPTGSMSIARGILRATVLTSGQVLITGGTINLPGGGPGTTNVVEIYDPVSGAFSPAASMIQARQQHTATLLPNGQVLVTGGFDSGAFSDLSSAELFSAPVASVLTVEIDVKPGRFPNNINPRSRGKIPVAILTTDAFDATSVDPNTVRFGRDGIEASPVRFALKDVDGDGDIDMILRFNTQDTGIQRGDTSASLTGMSFGGQAIGGSDSVNTVRRRQEPSSTP